MRSWGDESRLLYHDACCIIFMVFSRGRYDSRTYRLFLPPPFDTVKHPPRYHQCFQCLARMNESSEIPRGPSRTIVPLIIPGGPRDFD